METYYLHNHDLPLPPRGFGLAFAGAKASKNYFPHPPAPDEPQRTSKNPPIPNCLCEVSNLNLCSSE